MVEGAGLSEAQRALVGMVLKGELELEEMAGALGVDMVGLAGLLGDHGVGAMLEGLRVLSDLRNAHLLSRYRFHAIARLVHLSGQEEDGELSRKASVDLLKAVLSASLPEPAEREREGGVGVDESVLRGFLSRVGLGEEEGEGVE